MEDSINTSPIRLGMTGILFFGASTPRTTKMGLDDSKMFSLYSQTHGRTETGCIEIASCIRWEMASGRLSICLTRNFTSNHFLMVKSQET